MLHIVCVDKPLTIAVCIEERARGASARLHGAPGLEARQTICGHSIFVELRVHQGVSIGVVSREVEEVNAGEDDEESTEQGDRIDGICSVESLEKDK